CQHAFGIQLTF
nr:immunoglobulin light chain junction region [Macaca mulatta]